MGFFSWNTQDTNESIASRHSRKKTKPVYLLDDKGNSWKEDDYEGYGEFGGKDYYELLAEMNEDLWDIYREKNPSNPFDEGTIRDIGIKIQYNKDGRSFKSPNLVSDLDKWVYKSKAPKNCFYQGFFY